MPVRSLTSSVHAWPSEAEVWAKVAAWVEAERLRHPELLAVGVFGSYGRGQGGVGSDLDVLLVVGASDRPFHQRAVAFAYERLPLPADVLVYTSQEWRQLLASGSRFARTLQQELRWVWQSPSWQRDREAGGQGQGT